MKKLSDISPYKYLGSFKIILTLLLVIMLSNSTMYAQNELDVIRNNWLKYTDAANSMYNYITGQAYDLLTQRESKIASLNSLSDWQQRQKAVKETLMNIVGPFPEKTPLNAKITRVVIKGSYRVEHIVYESQPGFFVTSSLFIPGGLKKSSKAPAILYVSGHSNDGYRSRGYQHVILNLVNKGFIVFAIDPVGQGERLEYFDQQTGKSLVGGPTKEHSYAGAQAFITGSSQAKYMIWDGIRAVDYLLTRKEVDPARIGVTGQSGGGTQSSYIFAFDERTKAGAPVNYITGFRRLLESIGPQDAEQNFYRGILNGITHADLLEIRAPNPALIGAGTRDFFSIQGARESYAEIRNAYKAYGAEENIGIVEDDFGHGYTVKIRERLYAFFQKHLNNPGSSTDEEVTILTADEMKVTSTGQVSTSLLGETVYSLNRKEAEKLVTKLDASRNDLSRHLPLVLNSAKQLSGYQEPTVINEPVFTGRFQRENYVIEKYFVKGEGDYVIPYLLVVPARPNNKAIIYLHPAGKSTEASAGGELEWFARNGFTVLAPDMIGVGELGPGKFTGDAYIEGISHNIWYASMLIGRSIVGIRAGDVIRLTRLLKSNSAISEVYGVARKEMAPVLLHAAAFDPAITRITLIEPYSSYYSIVMNHYYSSSFIHGVVPGALKSYDLPDLAASLAPRKLIMAGTTDGYGKKTDPASITRDLAIVKAAYQNKNAADQLNIVPDYPTETRFDLFREWIK